MPRRRRIFPILRIVLVLLLSGASGLAAQEITEGRPAEFMIYQYPNVKLLIRIEVPEASFVAEITGPENALLRETGLPELRIGPVYQYIEAVSSPRQLMIKVTPERAIEREGIQLELVQLSVFDRNSEALARAYKNLSYGAERVRGDSSGNWASKAYAFHSAGREFAGLGMEEMRLWSDFFAAHVILHKLNDEQTVLEVATGIDRAARRAGFDELELAALTLQSGALERLEAGNGADSASSDGARLHQVLQRRAALAASLGRFSDQARALFSDAAALEREGQLDAAIARFSEALDAAELAADLELANEIRSAAALVYEDQGSTEGAIEMLEGIRSGDTETAVDDTVRDVADSLFERGRLLNRSYRYNEAAVVLEEALALRQSSDPTGAWGGIGLELGRSHFALGEIDAAIRVLEASLPRTPRAGNGAALAEAYGNLASISRSLGQFEAMERYRELQSDLGAEVRGRAPWLLERALDRWRSLGRAAPEVRAGLRESERLADREGDGITGWRARLYACLSEGGSAASNPCAPDGLRTARSGLTTSGIPVRMVESAVLDARLRLLRGDSGGALRVLSRVVGDIRFYQSALPGVLGAWYWENREAILADYQSAAVANAGAGSGRAVLLAWEHVRQLERADVRVRDATGSETAGSESLRTVLARRVVATGEEGSRLGAELNAKLAALRGRFDADVESFGESELEQSLAGLGSDAVLMSWLVDGESVYGVLADRSGIRVERVGQAGAIRDRLDRVLAVAGVQEQTDSLRELDALGSLLLGRFEARLAERIYVAPGGLLNGFPVEALRLGGGWLAERHSIVHLGSLDALRPAGRRPPTAGGGFEQVFLAGNPRQEQQLFDYGLTTNREIATVRDRFIGPGLHIVQGVALQKDEFGDERFETADLIHLAMPGSIDLASPEQSRLLLSSISADDPDRFLTPAELRSLSLSADLVVFSGTLVSERSNIALASRRGFVSDALEAGAPAVLSTLWPLDEDRSAAFMGAFYDRLKGGSSLIEALTEARRNRIAASDSTKFGSWAGFQLHIR